MFISLMRRNIKKNHKENSIYFVSLIISIIAFYVILSLEEQDVMQFLKRMESDAVQKLLGLISGVYGFSLFIIFFLIYFAEKYQLERASHEYGVLLVLGMKRSRLFLWLVAQDVYSGVLALAIGLPVAVFLSEALSLVTAKLTGLGIIGHHFTLSGQGILLTVLGFSGIKLAANVLLSFQLVKREPCALMNDTQEEKLKSIREKRVLLMFLAGLALLVSAYAMAIQGVIWEELFRFAVMLVFGTAGTFLVIKGFCAIFCKLTKSRGAKETLHIFTFRQLQENVFLRSGSLTISSLLVLIAIVCMSYGIAVAVSNLQSGSQHNMDFTFGEMEEESSEEFQRLVEDKGAQELIEGYSAVEVAYLPTESVGGTDTDVKTYIYDTTPMREAAEHLNEEERDYLENIDIYRDAPHMISLSSINELHKFSGKRALSLGSDELLIYVDPEFYGADAERIYGDLLQHHPKIMIDGEEYVVKGVCSEEIVVDRSITIAFGIVLPDEKFMKYADKENISTYWNVYLSKSLIEEMGLMQAIMRGNEYFSKSGLEYENYLQNIGRQLFYIVAASYLTIYLALVFSIIANTVLSLQYLTQEKKNRRRYHTLICLGSTYEALCVSAQRQIRWYFGVPLAVAAVSSIFGVLSMLSGMVPSSLLGEWTSLLAMAFASIIILCVIEYGYVRMVMRLSRQNIMQMMELKRSE